MKNATKPAVDVADAMMARLADITRRQTADEAPFYSKVLTDETRPQWEAIQDQYKAEYVAAGKEFGLPKEPAPPTAAALRKLIGAWQCGTRMLASDGSDAAGYAKDRAAEARQIAIDLRGRNPSLAPLPEPLPDKMDDLAALLNWTVTAEQTLKAPAAPAPRQKPATAKLKSAVRDDVLRILSGHEWMNDGAIYDALKPELKRAVKPANFVRNYLRPMKTDGTLETTGPGIDGKCRIRQQ